MGGMSMIPPAPPCPGGRLACAASVLPVFAADGSLWLAWSADGRIWVAHSGDLGRTHSKPVAINAKPATIDSGPDARPSIVIDRQGRIIVAYAVFKDDKFNGEVFVSRSTDHGAHFSVPKPITDIQTSQRFPVLSLDPDGQVFASWLDKREVAAAQAAGENYSGAALAFAWSKDGGASFDTTRLAHSNTCECCRINVAFTAPGRPVVVFRNIFGTNTRDHAVITFDGPSKPGPIHRVSTDDWKVNACPHQGPDLAIGNDGAYHVTYFTQGKERQGIFYVHSSDGGKSFSKPLALGDAGHQLSRARVLSVPGSLWLAWKDFDGDRTTIFGMVSHDNGAHWSKSRTLARTPDASDQPILVSDGKHPFLSWLTTSEGYRLIPLRRFEMRMFFAALLLLMSIPAMAADFHPFVRGSWKDIKARHAGRPTIVHFWSITCAPCLTEMPLWVELAREKGGIDMVFVSTDAISNAKVISEPIDKAGLAKADNWAFADRFTDKLHYEVNPRWQGELPYTVLIARSGKTATSVGEADPASLKAWISSQKK